MPRISRTTALAAVVALAGVGVLGGPPAQAQNTYADFPFNQGSLRYRPSGLKPPPTNSSTTSNTAPRRFFRRQRPTTYVAPQQVYRPAYPAATPGYGAPYAPQSVVPTTRYYYPPTR